jgi:spermidine synthase
LKIALRGKAPAGQPGPVGVPLPANLTMLLFVTGLLGIGYEVLMVRVISQVLESAIYTKVRTKK